jgi:hypothetical protein
MNDNWIGRHLKALEIDPIMQSIWLEYLIPTRTNTIRFHVDIMAYPDNPLKLRNPEEFPNSLKRLINLARFAKKTDVKLLPIFAGTWKYQNGKEKQFINRTKAFVEDWINCLEILNETDLYRQVVAWQFEDEMNHFIRHAGWKEKIYTEMLLETCESVRYVEKKYFVPVSVPRMVIFPADMMFFKDFLYRPLLYIPSMIKGEYYNYELPDDFMAFVSSDVIDMIGVDMYPGLYAPLATTGTFVKLIKDLCKNFGLQSLYHKQFIVAEAGYPTWPGGIRQEYKQNAFYRSVLSDLWDYYANGLGEQQGFLGVLWYCLNDQKIRPILWPPMEWRFGVLKTIPRNEWFATYPSDPKQVWYSLCEFKIKNGGE